PSETVELIKSVLGPADNRQHVRQKNNIRRLIGYGFINPEAAIACSADRATFWATGVIDRNQRISIDVPVPACLNGQALPHSITATLAWISPVNPNRQAYKAVRLCILDNTDIVNELQVNPVMQPDLNQVKKGTVSSRMWSGRRSP